MIQGISSWMPKSTITYEGDCSLSQDFEGALLDVDHNRNTVVLEGTGGTFEARRSSEDEKDLLSDMPNILVSSSDFTLMNGGGGTGGDRAGVSFTQSLQSDTSGVDVMCSVRNEPTSAEWLHLMTSMKIGPINIQSQNVVMPKFQYMLAAATSPLMNVETLTYLNQGQSYDLRLKRLNCSELNQQEQLYKSIVRVVFHERRLQYIEKEQLDSWKHMRPGERIIDIDIPLSYGLVDVNIDPQQLNSVEFVWDPMKETGVFIKVHCISTEFTAKKHGGEKGVPFRLQVETYTHFLPDGYSTSTLDSKMLLHCASCQIKVFKPKGADRKHKRDRDRFARLSQSEKEKFQPSYDYTILTEIPVEQVLVYLEHVNKNSSTMNNLQHSKQQLNKPDQIMQSLPGQSVLSDCALTVTPNITDTKFSHSNFDNCMRTLPQPQLTPQFCGFPGQATTSQFNSPHRCHNYNSTHLLSSASSLEEWEDESEDISTFDADEVGRWLVNQRFKNYVRLLQNFSGADLLRLSRDDLIQICGLADGIRLNNALQSKNVRPKLTLYVSLEQPKGLSSLKKSHSWNLDSGVFSSPIDSPDMSPSYHSSRCMAPAMASRSTRTNTDLETSRALVRAVSVGSILSKRGTVPDKQRINAPQFPVQQLQQAAAITNNNVPASGISNKRQFTGTDDDDTFAEAYKKHCMGEQESCSQQLYHALFLEQTTYHHLMEKLAMLLSIKIGLISQISIKGPSSIHVIVTDEVVKNLADQSRYLMTINPCEDYTGRYQILLKSTTELQ